MAAGAAAAQNMELHKSIAGAGFTGKITISRDDPACSQTAAARAHFRALAHECGLSAGAGGAVKSSGTECVPWSEVSLRGNGNREAIAQAIDEQCEYVEPTDERVEGHGYTCSDISVVLSVGGENVTLSCDLSFGQARTADGSCPANEESECPEYPTTEDCDEGCPTPPPSCDDPATDCGNDGPGDDGTAGENGTAGDDDAGSCSGTCSDDCSGGCNGEGAGGAAKLVCTSAPGSAYDVEVHFAAGAGAARYLATYRSIAGLAMKGSISVSRDDPACSQTAQASLRLLALRSTGFVYLGSGARAGQSGTDCLPLSSLSLRCENTRESVSQAIDEHCEFSEISENDLDKRSVVCADIPIVLTVGEDTVPLSCDVEAGRGVKS